MLIQGIDVGPLLKARAKFEAFRQCLTTEQEKAGAIQAFEYTYELAWKTMKRFIQGHDVTVYGPRDTFREAGLAGLIKDPAPWFDFIKTRNVTVHTYDEEEIQKVLSCLDSFSKELTDFLHNIGAINDPAV